MNLPYPQAFHCSFENFPPRIDVRLGALAGELVAGASLGTKFSLSRTPKSGVLQGQYVAGQPLPELRTIYSDTSSDDDFSLKLSFVGTAAFYKESASSQYLKFRVYKAIVIETMMAGEIYFGDTFTCDTLIPSSDDVGVLFDYDIPAVKFSDNAGEVSEFVITYNGKTYNLTDGNSITLKAKAGVYITYTSLNGLVISRLSYV